MYLDYFGFDEPPFSITPDPKFVFLSKKHQESLAHLVYGITRGGGAGFVQLTGEVGTGKTTICRLLLKQIPEKTNIALILNPTITPTELLENICKELGVSLTKAQGKLNSMVDQLNEYLLSSWSKGENTVVIIDEAQNLARDTLEQLRLLTNLETDTQKLLQIVLIGQPELRSTMRRKDLRQLAQRVTARYHLMPLSIDEIYHYLNHRIDVAGGSTSLVDYAISKKVFAYTQGIPRLINVLMDRALLAAFSSDSSRISRKHLKIAALEVMPETRHFHHSSLASNQSQFNPWMWNFLIVIAILISAFAYRYNSNQNQVLPLTLKTHQELNATLAKSDFIAISAEKAWDHYFKLWDATLVFNWHNPRCPKSSHSAMACLRRQGNINQIIKLNHPVMLQLQDGTLVLLSEIDDDMIGLLDHTNAVVFKNKSWLDHNWLGTYFIIWSMPAELLGAPNPIEIQNWSLEMANSIAKNSININQLNDWIVAFQHDNGLLADGIIGSETQMAISLNAYNGPTLK